MHHLITRETAYARLIVAITADPYVSGREASDAIDALVSRFIESSPEDRACHAHMFGMVYCDACAMVGAE